MRNGSKFLPWTLVALLTIMLVVISQRHRTLRKDFLEHRRADGRAAVGMFLPSFAAVTVTGEKRTVGTPAPGGSQILLYLTSTCPYCKITLPYWKRIPQRLIERHASKAELISVTTDSLGPATSYSVVNALPFALVPFPDRKLMSMYKAFSTPQTVVIDSTGRVVYARHGVINTAAAIDSAISAAIGMPASTIRKGAGPTSAPAPR